MKEEEIWKDIRGFPGYQVSNLGRVYSNLTNKFLKPEIMKKGYLRVALYNPVTNTKKRIMVHKLVANEFIGVCPEGFQVDHKDGNKKNNCVSNLEYVTCKENINRAIENGLRNRSPSKYTLLKSIEVNRKKVRCIETGEVFESIIECSKRLNVSEDGIRKCINHRAKSTNGLHFECVEKTNKKQSFLYPHQKQAIDKMFNGCILNGGVGSGKSRTGLYYYFKEQGGYIDENEYLPMDEHAKDLYIITTALKRNSLEWEGELANYLISKDPAVSMYPNLTVVIDSWNNIKKYIDVKDAFFIFDEQKVVGSGTWVKSFLKITKYNDWILLSATPGDRWIDFVPVFIANGFYKNKTEFTREHCVYSRYTNFPKIEGYINTGRLVRLRNKILIDMDFTRHTVPHHEDVYCSYDICKYKEVMRTRWDPYKNEPIQQASGLCYVLRRIVNESEDRVVKLLEILEDHQKAIIFYSFDYEREMLLHVLSEFNIDGDFFDVAEWSGHAHEEIPKSDRWIYLVQYTAGCEGFNCIRTDTIIFFSQNYSYRVLAQACGRIDRLNTPYKDLYYYHLKSRSGIDLAISKALKDKKKFNETRWVNGKKR